MPKIKLIWFGKEGRDPSIDVIKHYEKRIKAFTTFERIAIADEHAPTHKIEQAIGNTSLIVGLDDKGKQCSSTQFADHIRQWDVSGVAHVTFVIGGSYGLPDVVRTRAAWLMSLGPMTLPHRLAQAVLCEQIYRAYSIVKNMPYHHE